MSYVPSNFKRIQNVVFCDDNFGMIAADIIRDLFRIFQIDGVSIHSDSESFYGLIALLLRYSAYQ